MSKKSITFTKQLPNFLAKLGMTQKEIGVHRDKHHYSLKDKDLNKAKCIDKEEDKYDVENAQIVEVPTKLKRVQKEPDSKVE